MKRPIVHRERRRRLAAIRVASLGAFVALAGAWLVACGSVTDPTSGSSSGAGGDATSSTASSGVTSSGASTSNSASSSSTSSSSASSSSGGSGLVFVGGGLATVSEAAPGAGNFALIDQEFETTARACSGKYCVVGGLVP